MKRIILVFLLGVATATYAQIPQVPDPVCAYCDVPLKTGEAHKSNCPYYEAPKEDESSSASSSSSSPSSSSSSGSTHLRDYKPKGEVKSKLNVVSVKYEHMYKVGQGVEGCPYCHKFVHDDRCAIKTHQDGANKWRAKAMTATTLENRETALKMFYHSEDMLLYEYDNAMDRLFERDRNSQQAQSTQQNNATYTHTVTPGAYILKNYDKELSFGSDFARALGATMPNGEERWLLANAKGEEVGQFSKVEFVEANGIDQYILVRDDNAKWGIYSRGGTRMCEPKFESVKMLSTIVNEIGGKEVVFDVTMRNNNGVLQHGIYNPGIEEINRGFNENKNPMTIPCEYDYVELIDRSSGFNGTLVKVRKNGLSGVIGTFNGETVIPVSYSYVNTYFTLKGGMYLLVGDGNRMGAYHVDDEVEEFVPVTDGYTLDKVKSLIAEKEKE